MASSRKNTSRHYPQNCNAHCGSLSYNRDSYLYFFLKCRLLPQSSSAWSRSKFLSDLDYHSWESAKFCRLLLPTSWNGPTESRFSFISSFRLSSSGLSCFHNSPCIFAWFSGWYSNLNSMVLIENDSGSYCDDFNLSQLTKRLFIVLFWHWRVCVCPDFIFSELRLSAQKARSL